MSEPEERDQPDGAAAVEGNDDAGAPKLGTASSTGRADVETSNLADSGGVGISVGEPNTFEPEEAGPPSDKPAQ
jgi:hypothetical protein